MRSSARSWEGWGMSSEWALKTVGEFCPFKYGKGLPERDRKPGVYGVISSAGLVGTHDVAYVNSPGVVIGRKGTVGSVTYSAVPFWPIDTAFYVEDQPSIRDIRFTYYLLKTLNLHSMNTDSAVPGLNRDNAHALEVRVPPISEQKEIADFLQQLDDRITLLRETNTTLDAIAQALFKSWFVDFDPVHAKMQGRTPEGMDEATATLFPDSFEESELGPVPKGWGVGKLFEIASLKGGKMLDKAYFTENGEHPVFGGAGVMGYSGLSNAEGFVITVGRVGANCGQYFWHQGKAWVNNNASLVSPSNPDHSSWLFLWLKSVDMDLIKKGAAQPFVSNGDISELKIVLPPYQIIENFVQSIDPIFQRLSSITNQIKSLESLRDTLLPRLISGQLSLAEAATETI